MLGREQCTGAVQYVGTDVLDQMWNGWEYGFKFMIGPKLIHNSRKQLNSLDLDLWSDFKDYLNCVTREARYIATYYTIL